MMNIREETGIEQEVKVVFNKFNFLRGRKLEARHKSAAKYTDALQYFIQWLFFTEIRTYLVS